MEQRIVKIAQLSNDKSPFIDWLESLDKVTKSRIQSRLTRLLENNFGDHKRIDNEISELRLKFGSGYRIYYTEIDNIIVLLINGGNKSTQSKDIQKAKEILQEWRNIQ
ncbi:type II toxin-antitoxin system RelE/ParE family toxin [bacterium]|nr:type II toxin-antitoxin system RelE/ParE family toxin [bacterium]